MRLLVIDDDRPFRQSMQKMVEESEHALDTAASAKTAIKMMEKQEYDILLVDFKMPVHDGLWFMRNAKIPKHTKAILVTGYISRKVINQMFKLGAVGYLVKPFNYKELQMHLEFHSSRK